MAVTRRLAIDPMESCTFTRLLYHIASSDWSSSIWKSICFPADSASPDIASPTTIPRKRALLEDDARRFETPFRYKLDLMSIFSFKGLDL